MKNKMLQEMKQELKNRRLPVLFVTHDRDEAFALGHKICAMHDGKNEAVEEALFEWDIYLRFEGASEEFLWKLEKENTKSQQLLQIPEDFFVLKEHVLFLGNLQ